MLYNAVANGGKLMQPYLVSSIKNNGIMLQEFEPVVLEEALCKPDVIKAAQQCMEAVVTEGTGKPAFADCPFPVAGKTGTAHVAGGNVKYYDGVYQASFAGYFPANNPQYTCIVVIKTKPHAAQHYGGQLAAPVLKKCDKVVCPVHSAKDTNTSTVTADSLEHTFAGNTNEIKEILDEFGMAYKDSANNNPGACNGSRTEICYKASACRQGANAGCTQHDAERCFISPGRQGIESNGKRKRQGADAGHCAGIEYHKNNNGNPFIELSETTG
jgi:cell division protein FtsI (penicillin-binding protein 3)